MVVRALGGKCAFCDATDRLEIDHVEQGEKSFNITKCMTIALPRLLAEVSKCRLLCVEHHRETPSYGRARARSYEDTSFDVESFDSPR